MTSFFFLFSKHCLMPRTKEGNHSAWERDACFSSWALAVQAPWIGGVHSHGINTPLLGLEDAHGINPPLLGLEDAFPLS